MTIKISIEGADVKEVLAQMLSILNVPTTSAEATAPKTNGNGLDKPTQPAQATPAPAPGKRPVGRPPKGPTVLSNEKPPAEPADDQQTSPPDDPNPVVAGPEKSAADIRHDADDFNIGPDIWSRPLSDVSAERVAPSEISFHKGLVDNGHAPSALVRRKRVTFVEIAPGDDSGSEGREEPGVTELTWTSRSVAIRSPAWIIMRLFLVPPVSSGVPAIADIRVPPGARISS